MDEVTLVAGDGDDGLRERLDQEINASNAFATGYHDARLLSVAASADDGGLRAGLYGWTWGGRRRSGRGGAPVPGGSRAPTRLRPVRAGPGRPARRYQARSYETVTRPVNLAAGGKPARP